MSLVPVSVKLSNIVNTSVTSKKLAFSLASVTSGATSITTSQSVNQITTFPDITDTISCESNADTYTNKTITSATNNITGRSLFSGASGNTVSVYASANPSAGQLLMATSSTTASWTTVSTSDPMTTIGDMIYRNAANTTARLPLGSQGQFLRTSGLAPPNDVVWNEFIQPLNESVFFDDFGGAGSSTTAGATGGPTFAWATSGSSTVTSVSGDATGNWIGGVTLTLTSGATATSLMYLRRTLPIGVGQITAETAVYFPALSTSSQTYNVYLGFTDHTSGTTVTDGIYFFYSGTSGSSVWGIASSSGGLTSSTVTSSSIVAATWYRLKIIVNSAATLITYYVNDVSIGTINSFIPATEIIGPSVQIYKTVGSGGVKMVCDYYYYAITFSVSRI